MVVVASASSGAITGVGVATAVAVVEVSCGGRKWKVRDLQPLNTSIFENSQCVGKAVMEEILARHIFHHGLGKTGIARGSNERRTSNKGNKDDVVRRQVLIQSPIIAKPGSSTLPSHFVPCNRDSSEAHFQHH
jgi:hypothetical protein